MEMDGTGVLGAFLHHRHSIAFLQKFQSRSHPVGAKTRHDRPSRLRPPLLHQTGSDWKRFRISEGTCKLAARTLEASDLAREIPVSTTKLGA